MSMSIRYFIMICFCVLFSAQKAYAGIAVIVNPAVTLDKLSIAQAVNIFLGKSKLLPNGVLVIPIDQGIESKVREEFYKKLAQKNQNQLNAYWARQVFTGKGQPPNQVNNSEEVKLLIANNPGMIGYINIESVDDTVKAVLSVP